MNVKPGTWKKKRHDQFTNSHHHYGKHQSHHHSIYEEMKNSFLYGKSFSNPPYNILPTRYMTNMINTNHNGWSHLAKVAYDRPGGQCLGMGEPSLGQKPNPGLANGRAWLGQSPSLGVRHNKGGVEGKEREGEEEDGDDT